jgi:heptosyltransferase II
MERLLIVQSGFLGDVVLTSPLIAALRHRLAPESLTVLTTQQAQPLLEHHPSVDRVLVDAKRTEGRGIIGLWRAARQVRRQRYTTAVAPHKSLRTALLLALAGIPRRVGFRQSPGWFLYHQTVVRDAQRHEIERILCLMRAFGVEPDDCDRRPYVEYDEVAYKNAQTFLSEANITATDPVFVLCPGSVWPTKRWTIEGFAGLVRRLEDNYGRVLLCGSPQDRTVTQVVYERAGARGVNLAGRADLATFMALVDRARLVVSNDSAPMHIAVARNAAVVAVFCSTTPSLGYGPYSERAVIVEKKDLFCRPCSRHGGPHCPLGTGRSRSVVSPLHERGRRKRARATENSVLVTQRGGIMPAIRNPQSTTPNPNGPTLGERFHAVNVNSSREAATLVAQGQRARLRHIVLTPFFTFLDCYLRKGEWRRGIGGLITAAFTAYAVFTRWVKVWESQQQTISPPQS